MAVRRRKRVVRGKTGRAPAVGPTVAETALVSVARRLRASSAAAPTSAAIAREAGWSRQRAHALVLRCEAKGLVSRVDGGGVEVRA